MVLLCPSCGTSLAEDQKFCGKCGTKLVQLCGSCGKENPPDNRFCGSCGADISTKKSSQQTPRTKLVEERRLVTVLFADLSGFTSMSEHMDPEDVKTFAHHCVEKMSEVVRKFGGTVVNVMGDAILVVFGAPVAYGDDAERAVRAGLAIRDCSFSERTDSNISVHIGINTGEVMAGYMGPEERREYTVMGDTVNTASRLMSAARTGTALVGEETYRATRKRVRYSGESHEIQAKGKQAPVKAWEALEVMGGDDMLFEDTSPFSGREKERELLSGIWGKIVSERRPHLVTLLGEAGMGKTRLVREMEKQFFSDAQMLRGQCLPYGEMLGYSALAQAIKNTAGIPSDMKSAEVRGKFSDLVKNLWESEGIHGGVDETVRHLLLMHGLDTGNNPETPLPDARTLHTSVRYFLEALSRRKPVCLILDDVQWADNALLDFIEFAASRAQNAPILFIVIARPELTEKRPTWGGGVRAFTSLFLEPLDENAARNLVASLCEKHELSGASTDTAQILRVAGGNPLFAEELVATVAEKKMDVVPSTIKVLISARLDMLSGHEKKIIQAASVFGSAFWESGVEILSQTSSKTHELLEALSEKDFIRREARSQIHGDAEYAFKNMLIRDVAYEILPKSERRALHERALNWLEEKTSGREEEYLDILSHHAVEAHLKDRALSYLMRAAERAGRAAAHREEAALLERAIVLADEKEDALVSADAHLRCGKAYAAVGLWTKARPVLEEALAKLPDDAEEKRAEIMTTLSSVCFWLMDTPGFRKSADDVLSLSEKIKRYDLQASAMAALAMADGADGNVHAAVEKFQKVTMLLQGQKNATLASTLPFYTIQLYWVGKFSDAVKFGKQAVELTREFSDTSMVMQALPHLGLSLAASGKYREAIETFEEAKRFGKEYGVDTLLARALAMYSGIHLELYDYETARLLAEEARELAHALNFPPALISAGIDLLFNDARCENIGSAEKLVESMGESIKKAAGWHGWLWKMRFSQARAEISLVKKNYEEAMTLCDETLEQSKKTGRVKYHAAALCAKAKALAKQGKKSDALVVMENALKIVRPINDPALFLRTSSAFLSIEQDEDVAREAAASAKQIRESLAGTMLLSRFENAVPMRQITNFISA